MNSSSGTGTGRETSAAVPNPWTLTWEFAWTRSNGGTTFFDHETGRVLWAMPEEMEHSAVVGEEKLRADPD